VSSMQLAESSKSRTPDYRTKERQQSGESVMSVKRKEQGAENMAQGG